MHPPWGASQHTTQITPEIIRVSTASHGGYHCTGKAQQRIETLFPGFQPWAGPGWYEEDCDWAIVALAHPEHFDDRAIYHAVATVQNTHASSGYFTVVTYWLGGTSADAAQARQRADAWATMHADDYEIGSLGSPPPGAPRGAWSVSFVQLRDGARRRAILADYPRQATYTDQDIDRLSISHVATTVREKV